MAEVAQILAAPFCMIIILVAIHSYLGMHVLRREVLFVDISLSQVAALGSALSLLFFDHDNDWMQLSFSLFATVVVSIFLSIFKKYEKQIPQEAIIGVTFAAASALMVLVLDRSPHGAEHLKEAMVGNILFVTWNQVLVTALIYTSIAAVHWVFYRQFWEVSSGQRASFGWDFLFYLLFGVIITFSTQHAGVLVVFSILVIPAALGMRIFSGLKEQLLAAWLIGGFSALLSFGLSYYLDFPAGPMIVTVLSCLFFVILLSFAIFKPRREI